MARKTVDDARELEWLDSYPLSPDQADRAKTLYGRPGEIQATVAARLGVPQWHIAAMLRKVSFIAFLPERDIYARHAAELGMSVSDYLGDVVASAEAAYFKREKKRQASR